MSLVQYIFILAKSNKELYPAQLISYILKEIVISKFIDFFKNMYLNNLQSLDKNKYKEAK